MNPEEYETLPTSSVGIYMMAGAIAGIMEHCVMYPLDSVKTRMQTLTTGPSGGAGGVRAVLTRMVQQEGLLRPIRGMGVIVVGAGPAHALYFSCYESIKEKFINSKSPLQLNYAMYAIPGALATVLHDGVMNPAEVVKQRLQMYNSPYRNVLNCIQCVYKAEGMSAFYRSYTTQLALNVPFHGIHLITYEATQSITNPERVYNPIAHVCSGAMAGAVAAAVTTPLDVCKTVLNTQQDGAQARGMIDAIKQVYRLKGLRGYFRGLNARVLYQMPSTAICWSVYEFFKYILRTKQDVNYRGTHTEESVNPMQSSSLPRSNTFQGAGLYFNNNAPTPVLLEMTRS